MATRRNNGDGSVYKYNDKWFAQIQIGTKPNGKPNIKRFSSKTEREVRKKLKEFKRNQGKFTSSQNSKKTTVKEYFEHWLYDYKYGQLKPQSFDRLESIVINHIIPELGHIQFANVTQQDVQSFIDKKQNKNFSYSTIKKIYDAINACYTYDYNKGENLRVCSNNPVYNIIIKQEKLKPKSDIKIFSPEELKRITEEIYATYKSSGKRKYPYGEAYLLIVNTGLRAGEALGLDKNIDLKSRKVFIGKTLITTKNRDINGHIIDKNKGTVKITKVTEGTKNKTSNRWIYLNDNAIKYIEALLELPSNCNSLIVNKDGNPVTMQAFLRQFKTILRNANIDMDALTGIHALRHTFATTLFNNGVDVKIVSKILGHSSVKITYDTYIHVIEKLEADIMQKIPNI